MYKIRMYVIFTKVLTVIQTLFSVFYVNDSFKPQ